ERRDRLEDRIVHGCPKLPLQVRLEYIREIAGHAIDHADPTRARKLLDEADRLLESRSWLPEGHTPQIALTAALRARARDADRARTDLERALGIFAAAKPPVVDMLRARALRPVAEAYGALGDLATALSVYRRALSESIVNRNSRPRTEDFCAICISLASHAIEPDAGLQAALLAVFRDLGDPW